MSVFKQPEFLTMIFYCVLGSVGLLSMNTYSCAAVVIAGMVIVRARED